MCSRSCGRDSKVPAHLHHHQFRPKYKEKYTRIKYMKFDLGLHIKLRHLNSWVELQTQPFFNNSSKLSLFSSLFYLLFLFLLSPLSPISPLSSSSSISFLFSFPWSPASYQQPFSLKRPFLGFFFLGARKGRVEAGRVSRLPHRSSRTNEYS